MLRNHCTLCSEILSPLTKAINGCNLDIVKLLLSKGAEKKLFLPCDTKLSCEMAKFLFDNGVDINMCSYSSDYQSLQWYISKGKLEIAKLLVESGANVNIKGKNGANLMQTLIIDLPKPVSKNYSDYQKIENRRKEYFELIKVILKNGYDVNQKNVLLDVIDGALLSKEIYPNTTASKTIYTIDSVRTEIFRLFISYGANVNVQNSSGETPLIRAIEKNNFELAKELISKGALIDAKDIRGETTLIKSSCLCQTNFVQFLIDNKADLNVVNTYGETALQKAYDKYKDNNSSDCLQTVKILKDAGAR